jgi:hypothetical protein
MSAGVMPKLQKQEPWELIQAFVKAQDDATLAAKDAQLRRDLQANSEAAADRRLERQHQLNIDSLKQQLEIKTPYEIAQEKRQEEANQRAAERQHGYALESQDRNTENAIKQHSTNQRNDFDSTDRVCSEDEGATKGPGAAEAWRVISSVRSRWTNSTSPRRSASLRRSLRLRKRLRRRLRLGP